MKLTLKRVEPQHDYKQYPLYHYSIDGKIILMYQAPKKAIVQEFKRYKLGLSKIPAGAKLLPTKEDRKAYNLKILGGWVCKKLAFTYGVYLASQDRILTEADECLYWALSQDEIKKFTDYEDI